MTDVVNATLVLPLAKLALSLMKWACRLLLRGTVPQVAWAWMLGSGMSGAEQCAVGRVWVVRRCHTWNWAHDQGMWWHEQGGMRACLVPLL